MKTVVLPLYDMDISLLPLIVLSVYAGTDRCFKVNLQQRPPTVVKTSCTLYVHYSTQRNVIVNIFIKCLTLWILVLLINKIKQPARDKSNEKCSHSWLAVEQMSNLIDELPFLELIIESNAELL